MEATIAVWHKTEGATSVLEGQKTQCASVLKPIYAWVADPTSEWSINSERAITVSDNDATDRLAGTDTIALAQRIAAYTGIDLGQAATWGRYMVDAQTISAIYHAFDVSNDAKVSKIKYWMSKVDPVQRMGLPAPMKAGWDLYYDAELRPHLVTNVVLLHDLGGVTVTTDTLTTEGLAEEWQTRVTQNSSAVIPLHLESLRDPRLRDLVDRGLSVLTAQP